MPVKLEYTDDGGAIVTGTGTIRASEVSSVNKRLYAARDAILALRYQIVDLTDVQEFDIVADEVRALAMEDTNAARINPDMVTAVVGNEDIAFGLLRMWEMNLDESAFRTSVFRSREEAEAWVQEMLASDDNE